MSDGEQVTVEADGLSVTTNYGTAEEAQAQLALVEVPEAPAAETPAEAEPRDPQTGQFTKGQAPAAKKPRNDLQARIDLAVKSQRDAERRAEAAERRAAELEARGPTPSKAPEPRREAPSPVAGDPDDPEPDPDDLRRYPDGQFDRKYLKEQARWEARQEMRTVHRYQQQSAHEQRERQAVETRVSEVSALMQKADPAVAQRIDPRLADAVPLSVIPHLPPDQRPRQLTIANWVAEQVFRSDYPTELAAHLSDPAEIQRLSTLLREHGERAALRDIARLETRFTAAPAATAVQSPAMSHAKKPIQPLGSSPPQADPDAVSDDMPIEEHIRRMNAKDRREGRL